MSYFIEECNRKKGHSNWRIGSVYFGGGTPSLAPISTVSSILEFVRKKNLIIDDDIEISIESNPTTVEMEKLHAFKSLGINRISLGIQSLNDLDLKFLGRDHSAAEGLRAIETSLSVMPLVNVDMIYARHANQTPSMWRSELNDLLKRFHLNHLSLYCLAIERNTPFFRQMTRGKLDVCGEEEAATMFDWNSSFTAEMGLMQYEVSNFARGEKYQSKHNLNYWNFGEYIGIGPGSSSRIHDNAGVRFAYKQILAPEKWIQSNLQQIGQPHESKKMLENDQLSRIEKLDEFLLLSLRKVSGISRSNFKKHFGTNIETVVNQKTFDSVINENLLVYDLQQDSYKPTEEGLRNLDTVVLHLMTNVNLPDDSKESKSGDESLYDDIEENEEEIEEDKQQLEKEGDDLGDWDEVEEDQQDVVEQQQHNDEIHKLKGRGKNK